jgi:hypothetical protein
MEDGGIAIDLVAGISVTDDPAALAWSGRLLGAPPTFDPDDREAVWQLADHGFVFIERQPAHAGHARPLLFVEDLDAVVAQIASCGLEPATRETDVNGVRKAIDHDPDGNHVEFGGVPR